MANFSINIFCKILIEPNGLYACNLGSRLKFVYWRFLLLNVSFRALWNVCYKYSFLKNIGKILIVEAADSVCVVA